MEALLKPDTGLTFWTVVNFLILAFLLAKFAWKPLIAALDERERKIRADIDNAKAANDEAQKLKADIEAKLDALAKESSSKIKEATALGESERQRILAEASSKASALVDAARVQIKADTDKAVADLRKEMINTTMLAVKKVIGKEADEKTSAQMVEDLLRDIKTK